jgi:putative exosortase-associated protein (TIGR04073 family)
MTSFRQFSLAALSIVLLLAQMPVFAVDYYQQQVQNEQLLNRELKRQNQIRHKTYGRLVADKALNGLGNMASAPLEYPKNIINLTNEPDSNIFYGIVGGVIRGSLDTAGRIINGATDFVTAPLPTKPVVQPKYVWDDFDKTNSYGQVFRLVDNPKIEPYVAPPPRPVAVTPPIEDRTEQYSQQTNQNLDTMFRKEMMK